MKKAIETRFLLYTILLGCSTIVERIITAFTIDADTRAEHEILFHTVSTFILLFLFILSVFGARKIVETEWMSRFLNKKRYIGGRWIEIVVDSSGKFHHYNVLDIHHGAYDISLEGTTFDGNLEYDYRFTSLHASLESGNILSYTFIQKEFAKKAILEMGSLEFFNHDTKSAPDEYFGNYIHQTDVDEHEMSGAEGERIVKSVEKEVLRLRGFRLTEIEEVALKKEEGILVSEEHKLRKEEEKLKKEASKLEKRENKLKKSNKLSAPNTRGDDKDVLIYTKLQAECVEKQAECAKKQAECVEKQTECAKNQLECIMRKYRNIVCSEG
jgi:hypothetical protein